MQGGHGSDLRSEFSTVAGRESGFGGDFRDVLTGEVVMAKSLDLLARLSLVVLTAVTIPSGFADTTIDRNVVTDRGLGFRQQDR